MPQQRPLGPVAAYVLEEEERQARRREQATNETLFRVRPVNPQAAALAQEAASVLGVSPLEAQSAAVQEEARARREQQQLATAPAAQRWLSDPDNAAVAHDQIEWLTDFERDIRRPWSDNPDPELAALRDRTPGARLARHANDWLTGVARSPLEGVGLAIGTTVRGAGRAGARTFDNTMLEGAFEGLADIGQRIQSGARNIGGTLTPTEQRQFRAAGRRPLPQNEVERGFVGDVGSGTGQVAAQITVAVATGGQGLMPSLFAQGVGQMDERVQADMEAEGRTEYTTADDIALVGGGVVTALSERLGLDVILGRLPKPVQDRLKTRLTDILVAGATEGGTEITEAVGQNALAIYALGEDTGLLDGTVEGGTVGAAVGSLARALILTAVPGRQHVVDQIRSDAAVADAQRFDSLVDKVAGNPLLDRSPERLRAFLNETSPDDRVYVPAEAVATFFQTNPELEPLIDEWGIRDQYEAALIGGSDVAIDAGTYLVKVAPVAHEAWKADLRHGLEAMSLKEAEAWKSGGEQALEESFEQAFTEAEAMTEEAAPAQQVYQEVFTQLREAGYTLDVARTQATVVTEMFRVEAARNPNQYASALEAYRAANLSIRAEFPASLRDAPPERTDALIDALRARRATPAARMAAEAAAEAAGADAAPPAVDEARPEDRAALSDLEGILADLGVDPATATNEQVRQALERVSSAPEGSPVVRFEQAKNAARALAQTYKALTGIDKPDFVGPVQPVAEDMVQIADAIEAAEHAPTDPAVAKAYKALIDETAAQFLMMGDITVEAWRGEGEPYANSRTMLDDVQQNGHLWFFLTEAGFGDGADTSGHPLLQPTGLTLADGTELLANDVFRIVHDYFGHAQQGFNFGPVGELNAYLEHASMYSDEAVPALAAETLMQNAWVNFGPHLRREDGSLPVRGEPDYVPIPERRFADQKAFIATPEVLALAEKARGEGRVLEQADGADRAGLTAPPVNLDGTITLTHFSVEPSLTETDPTLWGRSGQTLTREERSAISTHLPRTYFGIGVGQPGGYVQEFAGRTPYTVDIDASRLYDAAADPDGFRQQLDGVAQGDRVNRIERLIAAKYDGYWLRNELGLTATVFKPMAVRRQATERGFYGPISEEEKAARAEWQEASTAQAEAWTRGYDENYERVKAELTAKVKRKPDMDVSEALDVMIQHTNRSTLDPDTNPAFAEYREATARVNALDEKVRRIYMARVGPPEYEGMLQPTDGGPRRQIDTPEFKAWFGDSKVRSATGVPLIAFHGSGAAFDVFSPADKGDVSNNNWIGQLGSWFAAPADSSEYDIGNAETTADVFAEMRGGDGSVVYPVFLSIQNPAEFEGYEDLTDARDEAGGAVAFREKMLAEGYDGVVVRDSSTDGGQFRDDWVAFEPTQIKSAIGNRGTFDPADPRILFQSDAPPFFSALLRAVEASPTKAAPAAQWKATLAKTPGVKKEELEWSGINDWLDLASTDEFAQVPLGLPSVPVVDAKGNISRDQIVAFLRAGGVRVDEVVLGVGYVSDDEVSRYARTAEDWDNLTIREQEERLDEAREFMEQDRGVHEPQFSDWKLPGADDTYRELLLTLPDLDGPSTHWDTENVVAHARLTERRDADGKRVLFIEEVQSDWHQKGRDQGYQRRADPAAVEAARAADEAARAEYDRASELLISEVKRVYALAEGEVSQWAQNHFAVINGDGEFGPVTRDPVLSARALAAHMMSSAQWGGGVDGAEGRPTQNLSFLMGASQTAALRRTETGQARMNAAVPSGIPDAPFRTSWPALVMKRMIRWAVDHDFERVAWTTGAQQADRYSLSTTVGWIETRKTEDGRVAYAVQQSAARSILREQGRENLNGWIVLSREKAVEIFGQDLGGRTYDGATEDGETPARFDGDDLKIGGEGMRAFYDRNLVNITNDLVKRYGVKVGPVDMTNPALARRRGLEAQRAEIDEQMAAIVASQGAKLDDVQGLPFGEADDILKADPEFVAAQDAHTALRIRVDEIDRSLRHLAAGEGRNASDKGPGIQPGFDITPQLRDAAMSGFPLFQKPGSKGPRGQIALSDTGAVITVFQSRNLSTLFHEIGHFSLERLVRNAAADGASEQVKSDLRLALDYLNVRDPADIGRDQHELWARSMEAYLMEGRSPSLELRSVMKTIKGWFLSIYRVVTNLNAPITDEVRGVFDRLLATDEEIEATKVRLGIEAGFSSAEEAGMTPEAFADYTRLVDRARTSSEDDLMRRVMGTIRRERTAEWNAEADTIRPEVAAEIDEQPEIKALNWLRANKVSLNRDDVERMIGAEGMAALPKAVPPIVSRTGVHPDNVAEMAGYASGPELLAGLAQLEAERQALRATGDNRSVRAKRIEDAVTERLREQYGDPLTDGSIEAEATATLHGERQADVLGVELGVLGRRIGQTPPPIAALRQWAADQIGGRTVREAKPGKYLRAERTAANAVQKALAKKDRAEAFRQKQAQTINHLLYSEARKAEEFADRAVRRLSKLDKAKTIRSMDQDYLEQIHALLEAYELRPASGAQIARRRSLMEFVTEQETLGNEIVVPQALLDAAARKNYAELTVDELRALDDTIRSLAHLGRLKQTLLDNRDRRDYEQVVDEVLAQTQDLPKRKGLEGRNPKPNALRQWDAGLWKMETLFDWLDREQVNGVFNRVLLRPAVDASNREDQLHEGVGRMIRSHYDAVPKGQKKRWREKVVTPELIDEQTGQPSVFDRGDLIAMALNVGNGSNLDKLTRGESWTPDDVMAVLNRELTAEEWRMVQGIWDTLETLWPDIAATERLLTGVEPERVVPMPVQTATAGELRGGYYPVVYDPARRANAAGWAALETQDLFNGVIRGAATSKGHTKERTGYAGPILLSVEGVLFGHLNKVVKRIAYAEYVTSARKFITDNRIRKVITDKVGPEYYAQLMPWLQAQVTDRGGSNADLHGIERFVKRARLNFQMVAMGLRVSTGLAQIAGFGQSAAVVGKGRLAAAVVSYAASIRMGTNSLSDFVFERSEEMKQRMSNRDRDIRDAMRDLIGKGGLLSEVQRAAFFHIGIMDQFVSVPTWLAAYQAVLSEGGDESDAIAAGDKAVRRSQGSGREYALAAIQRPNSEFMKLFTLFYSYFSVQYNRQRDIARYATTGDPAKAISYAFWIMIAAPIMGAVLTGDFPDEDDGEGWQGWLSWASRKMFFNLFSGVPFARDASSYLERKVSGEYASYSPTPIGRAFESVETLGTDIADLVTGEEVSERWLKHAIETPGYLIGLPTGQIANTVQYVADVFDGSQRPDNLGEFLYGLAKGPQQDQEN